MTHFNKQSLSNLHDDEASELEVLRLINAIEQGDEQLLKDWQQLCAQRDVLDGVAMHIDIRQQVTSRIAHSTETVKANYWQRYKQWNIRAVAAMALFAVSALFVALPANQTQQPAQSDGQLAAQQRLQTYMQQNAELDGYSGRE